jgi:hypothetical protein
LRKQISGNARIRCDTPQLMPKKRCLLRHTKGALAP